MVIAFTKYNINTIQPNGFLWIKIIDAMTMGWIVVADGAEIMHEAQINLV